MPVPLDYLSNMPGKNSEMDTRGAYHPEDEDYESPYEEMIGLSRASLKKYSSPARRRILARQAAQLAARQASLMGFSLKPPKALRDTVKKATKAVKKIDTKKLNKLVKTYGPLVATVYPPAAPAVAAATVALNAVENGDPKAIAQVAATQAAAASGNPEAQQAVELMQAARNLKKATRAQDLLKAASSGDTAALTKVAAVKAAAASGDPKAAAALQTLNDVNQGAKNIARLKAQKEAAFSSLPDTLSRKAPCACPE